MLVAPCFHAYSIKGTKFTKKCFYHFSGIFFPDKKNLNNCGTHYCQCIAFKNLNAPEIQPHAIFFVKTGLSCP